MPRRPKIPSIGNSLSPPTPDPPIHIFANYLHIHVDVAIGVVDDAAVYVGFNAVLVNNAGQGGAVAEVIFEGFRRNAASARNWL